MRLRSAALLAAALALTLSVSAPAQEPVPAKGSSDFITPHISDAHHLEIPWPSLKDNLTREIPLPHWAPLHIGSFIVDLSPTKHVVMMLLAAATCLVVLISAARGQARHAAAGRPPKGLPNAIEAVVLYMRNEIILPNVGRHGDAFVPYCLTLFFFILIMNLLGLLPWGASATGNISVTATLKHLSRLGYQRLRFSPA